MKIRTKGEIPQIVRDMDKMTDILYATGLTPVNLCISVWTFSSTHNSIEYSLWMESKNAVVRAHTWPELVALVEKELTNGTV